MWDALNLAMNAHEGQVDKLGVPYIRHVTAVAHGVAVFGEQVAITGLLHDLVEDTSYTLDDLSGMGYSTTVTDALYRLTKTRDVPLEDYLRRITSDDVALWVKVADNAHNTLPERVAAITDEKTRARLAKKYALGREILWKALPRAELGMILSKVNPSLLPLMEAL